MHAKTQGLKHISECHAELFTLKNRKEFRPGKQSKCGTNFHQNKLKSSTDFVDSDQLSQFTNLPNQYTNKRRETRDTNNTSQRDKD